MTTTQPATELSRELRTAICTLAAVTRWDPTAPKREQLRRQVDVLTMANRVHKLVSKTPLTPAERDRILGIVASVTVTELEVAA